MRVARLIIYDGPEELIQRQLGSSQPDGIRSRLHGGVEMVIFTLPPTALFLLEQAAQMLVETRGQTPVPIGQEHYQVESERGQI